MTTTREMREEARGLLEKAKVELADGQVETFEKMFAESETKMQQAEAIDNGHKRVKALEGSYNVPTNSVPIVSKDVESYDANDTTATTKADYKPSSWINGLPAMSQPDWVREQMGDNLKEHAIFQRDTYVKWMKAPSEAAFQMSATPDEKKAMQEDTDAEGGFFVPEEFINQVIHDSGVPGSQLRPSCTVIRVSSKDGYLPTLASATWGAIAEEAAYSDQTPTVGQVSFSVEKSGGLIKVTRELLDDSAVNLPALLSQIFQESAGQFEDTGIISGNNTTQYGGIMSDTNVAYATMANPTSIVAADLLTGYYALQAQHRANATWIMKSEINNLINAIQITGNGVTGIVDITASPSSFLLGKPSITTDVTSGLGANITATEKVAIVGDMRKYYIFDRVGFTIRRNDSLYQENDQVGFFATRRGDGQVGLSAAFKILRAAAS